MLSLGKWCMLRFYEGSSIASTDDGLLLKRRRITQLVEWIGAR